MSQYRLVWEYRDGSEGGHGQPVDEAVARAAVLVQNRRYPNIHHWVEEVPVDQRGQ